MTCTSILGLQCLGQLPGELLSMCGVANMLTRQKHQLQPQLLSQSLIGTILISILRRELAIDNEQLVFYWTEVLLDVEVCLRVEEELPFEPILRVRPKTVPQGQQVQSFIESGIRRLTKVLCSDRSFQPSSSDLPGSIPQTSPLQEGRHDSCRWCKFLHASPKARRSPARTLQLVARTRPTCG